MYTTISGANSSIKNNQSNNEHLLNLLVFTMKDLQTLKTIRKQNGIKILFLKDIYQGYTFKIISTCLNLFLSNMKTILELVN